MTYLSLSLLFLAGTLVVLASAALLRRPDGRWWAATGLTALALLVLTAVFDTIMIAADLFRYNEQALVGVHVGLAPLEDFTWPLAAAALVPGLMLLAPRRRDPNGPGVPARSLRAVDEESTR